MNCADLSVANEQIMLNKQPKKQKYFYSGKNAKDKNYRGQEEKVKISRMISNMILDYFWI